jgi:hypothetical protein
LLEYLTSGGAIFGDGDLLLSRFGIDRGLLHLEAKFSHQKRMEKINAVLSRTLDHMGSRQEAVVRDFAADCPPSGIGWLDNARQFHDFLRARWQKEAPEPPYLPDIAAFEIAYARVQKITSDRKPTSRAIPQGAIRRDPAVVILRTEYDIRPILEPETAATTPPPRNPLCLALTMPEGSTEPIVHALLPELFALLDVLDDFAPREAFDELPNADANIGELAASRLIEVRR